MGEHGGRRAGVAEGVVVALERDVVAGADVGQAVGELALGIEAARQLQRAQAAVEREGHVGASPRRAR